MNFLDSAPGLVAWGIPIAEVAICFFAGRNLLQSAKKGTRGRLAVFAIYAGATSVPVALGVSVIKLGSYLGINYGIYVFFGEDVWALGVLTAASFVFAMISNIVFWWSVYIGTRKSINSGQT
jgi:hypothetical protein